MTEQEKQRLHNLEIAMLVVLGQLVSGREYSLDQVARDLYGAGVNMGAFKDSEIRSVSNVTH